MDEILLIKLMYYYKIYLIHQIGNNFAIGFINPLNLINFHRKLLANVDKQK